jgi:2-iminobutanoate/2-iminopropanoate deaminase
MSKQIVRVGEAPGPVGPYSQGVVMDGWIWTSGQVALDPASGAMVGTDAAAQVDRALRNIDAILRAGGSSLDQVVRVTVYLTDMNDFSAVNAVYARYFPKDFPARSCVEVARLPLGARVEIDAVARAPVGASASGAGMPNDASEPRPHRGSS